MVAFNMNNLSATSEHEFTLIFIKCLSFPLVGNPAFKRFWTSQNDGQDSGA